MTESLGALVVDVEGKALSPEDQEILAHPLVGGVIFFARNYSNRAQLNDLVQAIRKVRSKPLLIMVDQEGGRVQRFVNEFTRLPPLGDFGALYDQDQASGCRSAQASGCLMATELLSAGIDLSLAPILDLNSKSSRAIGDRAFHSHPEAVTRLANAYIAGMKEAGMAGTGKHFPGHGSIEADSHHVLPEDLRGLEEIRNHDLLPFVRLVKAGINAIMAAHILFPSVDKAPVGFSRRWLQDILREQLGFKGVIFSDDLNMEGANISADYSDRLLAAREAGCDFAMLCNNRAGVVQSLDRVKANLHQVNAEKWQPLRCRFTTNLKR